MAAVLGGDAVCISDRSRLRTSNLTVYARINYCAGKCFHCDCAIGKGSLCAKLIHLLLGYCRDKTYGKSALINSGILYNYFTASASSGSAGLESF